MYKLYGGNILYWSHRASHTPMKTQIEVNREANPVYTYTTRIKNYRCKHKHKSQWFEKIL